MSWLEIVVVIGVIGFVIYQQVAGQAVQGRRLIVLPAVLTVVGFLEPARRQAPAPGRHRLADRRRHRVAADRAGLRRDHPAPGAQRRAVGAAPAARPVALGRADRLARAGHGARGYKSGAHVAASTTPLLFTLGLNRLGQAAVIAARAMAAGIPFAPEKDGRTFLSGGLNDRRRDRSARY